MIDAFLDWIPGPLLVDIFAIVGSVLFGALFGGLLTVGGGLLADWRRSLKAVYPVPQPAVVVESAPVAVPEPRSPFRRKREAAK